ncbi:MAG: hypothetical protein ACHQ49_00045 [Elusimicrobiota bacterium]
MALMLRYFAWTYFRAFVWIALAAFALRRGTGNARIARAFVWAHIAALGLGGMFDFAFFNLAPKPWLVIGVLQWVFTAPIVIFTIISLWIGNRESPVEVPDVFMTLIPIVMWAMMVIHGWQVIWHCHLLGAWFVSAASGAVDLYVRCGPPWARRNTYWARFALYILVVMIVYLLVPRTEIRGLMG